MKFRELISALEKGGELIDVKKPVSPEFEAASVIFAAGERPIRFQKIGSSSYPLVAGLCSTRALVAQGLGIAPDRLLGTLSKAIDAPKPPDVFKKASCQEVVEETVDLDSLPLLKYFEGDGGNYITSAVAVIRDPDTGRNASFHRLMQIGKNRFTGRLVEGRQTHSTYQKLLKRGEELEIAFCIGNSTAVMLGSSVSPPEEVDELAIANALESTPLVKCKTKDIEVPADSEFILEGRITAEQTQEGPFVDLTETRDIVRTQPVIEIDKITHRKNAVFQTLLPGKREHKLLMGMPREPTIFREVNAVCECRNVVLTPGGCSWLHAVVQICKKRDDEPMKAIAAAFRGHRSLKHCVIVDSDIDINDPQDVEWAIATRFRAGKKLVLLENQPSSSLDPMADKPPGGKATVSKMGLDATMPLSDPTKPVAKFKRVEYRPAKVRDYASDR